MAGIWGDGQRGGIFGAKVDPRLQAELKRRAATKRQEMEPSLADQWHNSLANRILSAPSKLFGGLVVDPAVEGVTDLVTLAGDVYGGRQPTMSADPQTGEMHTDPRLSERAMNAAGTMTLGAGAIPAETNALRMGIKAYHGSPHDFERFDSSKIGTGEGAQAYGHGLYFGEREAVAQEYKKALAQTVTIDGKPLLQNNKMVGTTGRKSVDDELVAHNGDLEAAISNLEAHVSTLTPGQAARGAADDLAALKALRGRVSTANSGKMYEVDIAADPEHFLDWDRALAEQSPQVQQALGFREPGQIKALEAEIADIDSKADAILKSSQLPTDDVDAFWKAAFADTPQNAEYNALINRRGELQSELQAAQKQMKLKDMGHMTGEAYLRGQSLARRSANDPEKARLLREAGVPGIKYLDQGSRRPGKTSLTRQQIEDRLKPLREDLARAEATGVGQPDKMRSQIAMYEDELKRHTDVTHNYVVFDDKLISILRKYGLPISAAGLAALSQLHPEEARAAQRKSK